MIASRHDRARTGPRGRSNKSPTSHDRRGSAPFKCCWYGTLFSMTAPISARPGRNQPCHCGSGRKYKHCCLEKDGAQAGAVRAKAAAEAAARSSEAAASGVVARIVTGPHDANRRDPHMPMRYDTGRPRAVIRFRIAQPRTTSLPCLAGLRARRPSPMMDGSRKNAFSTRP